MNLPGCRAVAGWALLAALCGCVRAAPSGNAWRSSLYLPVAGAVPLSPLEGKVVLVKFLATWCFPCLSELAQVEALQQRYGNRGFTVVAVGMDREGTLVLRPFAEHYHLSFPVVVADERMRAGETPFGLVSSLPTTVLLARDGRVLAAWQGVAPPEPQDELIEKALKE